MQGYTYTKGEHYPVEHLVFKKNSTGGCTALSGRRP